jgi:carboxyl-terminal processing protease
MQRLNRLVLPALAVTAVAGAFAVSFLLPHNGLDYTIDGSARAQAARQREPYDLTQLAVLNRAILEVKDHYVEPERVNWQRMLLAGLNNIQRSVAPVLVHYEDGDDHLMVQVNDQRHQFRVDDVNAPWTLSDRFKEIFHFLQQNLGDEEDLELRDIEYAAVNGMLRTLDPHTVLLTPDIFEEMQMSTRGEFGGLGIVISIRDGHLTVIRPIDNTPASNAGIERGDRIVQINEESTLNMPLSEAVNRLRGAPGSNVNVWVSRKAPSGSWGQRRRVPLVRAVIRIESVEHKMLADNVGYIKINNFQGNTSEDMRSALAELHQQNLRGLVLDLRGNPGGLLDQAVRVADAFLPRGTIVTTSSQDPSEHEVKEAVERGTEPNYPMVVLINGSSASASEIVAGALKNHDRALVVGETSFGKGSVQVLYNFNDGSALKLTIAQYLTPGDVSIQGVGIVPDIAIDPMTVDREDMDIEVDRNHGVREADLESHLTHASARGLQTSATVMRYYLDSATRRRLLEAGPNEEENEEEGEFLTHFSQQLLARAERPGRREMLADSHDVIAQVAEQEMRKAIAELRRIGVDWSLGEDAGASEVRVEVSTDKPENVATAGDDFNLRVKVTNVGEHPLYQLRARTKSDNGLFDDRELVFGHLAPGQSREWTTHLGQCLTENDRRTCRIPRGTPDRADGLRIEFEEAHGHVPAPVELRTTIHALPKPQFAYSLQVTDDQGNGDGRIQRGERGNIYMHIKNVGPGGTYDMQANLRSLSGSGVLLREGRFELENMSPGDERIVRFGFEVLPDFEHDEIKFEVAAVDTDLREAVSTRLEVPVSDAGAAPTARNGHVRLGEGTRLLEAPDASAPSFAHVTEPIVLPVVAELGGFVHITLEGGQPAWVAAADAQAASRVARGGALAYDLDESPPRLTVENETGLVTRDDHLRIRGQATDDQHVRDLYVFAGINKVYYQNNRQGGDRRQAEFATDVPLHPGVNYITVVVRERDDVVSRKTLVVRRDGPNGELLETPDHESSLFSLDGEEEEP